MIFFYKFTNISYNVILINKHAIVISQYLNVEIINYAELSHARTSAQNRLVVFLVELVIFLQLTWCKTDFQKGALYEKMRRNFNNDHIFHATKFS